MTEKPEHVTDDHLEYLDELRETGVTNMYGAVPYLMYEYPLLTQEQARGVLSYWMRTFSERHKKGEAS